MERYKNRSGDSGVRAFDLGPGFIRVQFDDGVVYVYTDASAGPDHILRMQQLAVDGQGLNGYINQHVRDRYASRV